MSRFRSKRTIALWYGLPAGYDASSKGSTAEVMNFESGEWESFTPTAQKVRYLTLMCSSAVIGRGGSDTGELIVAYPMTSVSGHPPIFSV